ncbi:hypothetical protein D9M73_143500 [compost metagenome]
MVARLVVLAKHVACEALEFPRVVVSGGEAGHQGLSETAAFERRNTGRQHMLRRAAVDTQGLTLVAQFTGVAGRAGDIQKHIRATRVLVPGKACREVAGVVRRRFLAGVHQKAEAREVVGGGKALLREGQFEGGEPVIAQAFDLGALGGEVISLSVDGAPLLQVMHLLSRRPGRQFRVGDVIENHGQGQPEQDCDESQQA